MTRNGKDFRLMSIDTVVRMLEANDVKFERMVVHKGFAMNLDMERSQATSSLLSVLHTPFKISDVRILRLKKGSGKAEINFREYELAPGDIILVKKDSYFEIHDISEGALGEVLAFVPGNYHTNLSLTGKNVIKLHPSEREWDEISNLFYTIYSFACISPFREDVVEPLIAALVNDIADMAMKEGHTAPASGAEWLFNRFIEELNSTSAGKLPVSHYAERLCVTPQYLSRAVSQVSGKTVSQWINKAVVTKARILLREPSRTVSEIADILNFPNDSFFCRFFRRETGLTPTAFRRSSGSGKVPRQ